MIYINMDFGYAAFILLLVMHCCYGQTETDTADAPLSFKVTINPPYPEFLKAMGESVVLTCSTDKKDPSPTFRWEFDGEPITSTAESDRIHIVDQVAGTQMLRINDMEEGDSGKYTCIATLDGESDEKSTELLIIKPLEFSSTYEQFGVKGTDGEVKCEVTAKPSPTLTWKLSDKTRITNSDKYIIQTNKLIIKNLDFDDDGTYICDVVVIKTGDAKQYKIRYQVVELPVIPLPPTIEPNNPKVGDDVRIHCSAQGVPQPTYKFEKNDNPIPDGQVDATAGILTINDLKREDEASYKCIATNPGGITESSNSLDVKIPPKISDIPNVDKAVEGGEQNIECSAQGDPAPVVSWRKDGMDTDYTQGDSKPRVETESNDREDAEIKTVKVTLIFSPVEAKDAGKYTCSATNVVGDDKKEVKMAVEYEPHFDVDYKTDLFYGWRGHRANLTCQVSANSLANIAWKRKNREDPTAEAVTITNVEPYTVTDIRTNDEHHLSTSSLLVFINDDDQNIYGEYICEASNVRGTVTKVVTLTEALPPGGPGISVSTKLSTMITVSIEKPSENGGQPIKKYTYTYHKDGDQANEKTGTVDVAGEHTTINLKDLTPDTGYVIKVSASNAVGPGAETSVSATTLAVSKPLRLNLESKAEGEKPNSYTLRLAKPNDGGSPIKKFIIRYKQVKVNEDEDPDKWTVVDEIDKDFILREIVASGSTQFELKDLNRDSYYEVRIQAENKIGLSDEEYRIIKTSKGNDTDEDDGNDEESTDNTSTGGKDDNGNDDKKDEGGESATNSPSKDASASAGLGSHIIIIIVVIVVVLLLVIVIVTIVVVKKKGAAGKGDAEGGKAEDKKEAAEEEKLIQEDAKVENESEKKEDGIEETQEFEPDQKPEQPPAPTDAANDKGKDGPHTEPTIQITPETPEKPDNPSA